MEDRYAFSELIFDKDVIKKIIKKKKYNKKEDNTITLLIMGHGRERYKENFDKMKSNYSDPFIFKIDQQKKNNTVRILSKAGKPKICAWDYNLCTKTMSSQDIISELSHLFFSNENKDIDTFTLMNSLSVYFKTFYPQIIKKISRNYQDLPEDKDPGSPGAVGYTERYNDFKKVLESLEQNKFSQLKALNHEKVFTIRPDNEEEYNLPCEKYLFEIVELRTKDSNGLLEFIINHLKIRENLVKNYFSMTKEQIKSYIDNYISIIYQIYALRISDYEKYYLIKFIFNLYFGNEILLSEIIEFFVILDIDVINIIDNTCRVQERSGIENSSSIKTSEIEAQEQIKSQTRSKSSQSRSKSSKKSSSSSSSSRKTLKNKKI